MNVKEAMKAVYDESPVEVYLKDVDKWVECKKIISIVYSIFENKPIVSGTVIDRTGNSTITAKLSDIRLKE